MYPLDHKDEGLERVRKPAAGAAREWLALWPSPPLDRAIRERTLGLIDAAGREKPSATVLRRFAAGRRPVVAIPPLLEVDPDRYWREPKRSFEELWAEFTSG